MERLKEQQVSVKYDKRDTHKPGWKFAEYELKGVPVRVAIGPKDLEKGTVEIARRDTREKSFISIEQASDHIQHLLDDIQQNIHKKAIDFRSSHTFSVDTYDEFKEQVEKGFVYAHWDGTSETEEQIKEETKATIRCIPLDQNKESGKCFFSGKPSKGRVLFAKAY
jgi:prolyl-tRNA synthetase